MALVSLLAADFFVSEQYGKQLWLMMALAPALLLMSRKAEEEAEESERSESEGFPPGWRT